MNSKEALQTNEQLIGSLTDMTMYIEGTIARSQDEQLPIEFDNDPSGFDKSVGLLLCDLSETLVEDAGREYDLTSLRKFFSSNAVETIIGNDQAYIDNFDRYLKSIKRNINSGSDFHEHIPLPLYGDGLRLVV